VCVAVCCLLLPSSSLSLLNVLLLVPRHERIEEEAEGAVGFACDLLLPSSCSPLTDRHHLASCAPPALPLCHCLPCDHHTPRRHSDTQSIFFFLLSPSPASLPDTHRPHRRRTLPAVVVVVTIPLPWPWRMHGKSCSGPLGVASRASVAGWQLCEQ
jgi:hypothetical protein